MCQLLNYLTLNIIVSLHLPYSLVQSNRCTRAIYVLNFHSIYQQTCSENKNTYTFPRNRIIWNVILLQVFFCDICDNSTIDFTSRSDPLFHIAMNLTRNVESNYLKYKNKEKWEKNHSAHTIPWICVDEIRIYGRW